jgi:hypothetical protein
MPAHSDTFPWLSYYRHYNFFEARIAGHRRVRDLKRFGEGHYLLRRYDGSTIKLFICECYSFGAAEYLEATEQLGPLDAVIINSAWCGYSDELKIQCRGERVGLFTIKDFMASLNRKDFWMYLDRLEEERLRKLGLL